MRPDGPVGIIKPCHEATDPGPAVVLVQAFGGDVRNRGPQVR
jgi:hypothetical protein